MDATTKKREEMGSVKKDGDEEEKEEEEGRRGGRGRQKYQRQKRWEATNTQSGWPRGFYYRNLP
jgi:hypothetical protein